MKINNLIKENFCEYEFLLETVEHLKKIDLNLIITDNPYEIPPNLYLEKKTIVILTSDESGRIPCYRDKVFKIFRMYNNKNLITENIFPIPLGFCCYKRDVKIDLFKKDIDVIFLGQDTGSRHLMFDAIKKSKHNIYFNCSGRHNFRGGFSREEYIDLMRRSKISLVPDGHPNFETSRFSESFMFGCNVISNKKPDFWYYDSCPYYLIESDWSNLDDVIDSCIGDSNYENNLNYYDNKLSPLAVAKYIKTHIENL